MKTSFFIGTVMVLSALDYVALYAILSGEPNVYPEYAMLIISSLLMIMTFIAKFVKKNSFNAN